MDEEPEICVATAEKFTADERAIFIELVIAGGEVGGDALKTNVTTAKALAMLRSSGNIQGVAALKCPQASYRKHVSDNAGEGIHPQAFPYELGYVFLLQQSRGKGFSHRLVAELLKMQACLQRPVLIMQLCWLRSSVQDSNVLERCTKVVKPE